MSVAGRLALTLLVFLEFLPTNALSKGVAQEIQFLLNAIEQSGCIFIRNGDKHSAGEAAAHLAKKYSKVKKRIKTSEDFINKIATKSFLTGERYIIECIEGQPMGTDDWLRERLTEHGE